MRQGGRGEDQRSPLGVLGELEAGVFDGAVEMGDAPDAASAALGDFDRVELQGMADLDVKAIPLWQKRGMAALFNIPYAKSVSKLDLRRYALRSTGPYTECTSRPREAKHGM